MKTKTQLALAAVAALLLIAWPFGCENKNTGALDPEVTLIPEADFAVTPDSGCCPLNVQFTDLSKYNPNEWEWFFGDRPASDSNPDSYNQNPVHTYSAAGTYTVTLTALNGMGQDTKTKEDCITVTEPVPDSVMVLPWYVVWRSGMQIIATEDTAETTVVYGETWPNWEPVECEMVNGTINTTWNTTDFWGNPYSGSMVVNLDDSLTEVTYFKVAATLIEGPATRNVYFQGHSVPKEISTGGSTLYRLWGLSSCTRIDSLSDITVITSGDTTFYWKLYGFYCDDSSRVEIRITEL